MPAVEKRGREKRGDAGQTETKYGRSKRREAGRKGRGQASHAEANYGRRNTRAAERKGEASQTEARMKPNHSRNHVNTSSKLIAKNHTKVERTDAIGISYVGNCPLEAISKHSPSLKE